MNKIEACDILNLPYGKSEDSSAIKAAYRKLSKIHHPDKGGNCSQMAMINAAYAVLLENAITSPPMANDGISIASDIVNFMLANYLLMYTKYTLSTMKYYK